MRHLPTFHFFHQSTLQVERLLGRVADGPPSRAPLSTNSIVGVLSGWHVEASACGAAVLHVNATTRLWRTGTPEELERLLGSRWYPVPSFVRLPTPPAYDPSVSETSTFYGEYDFEFSLTVSVVGGTTTISATWSSPNRFASLPATPAFPIVGVDMISHLHLGWGILALRGEQPLTDCATCCGDCRQRLLVYFAFEPDVVRTIDPCSEFAFYDRFASVGVRSGLGPTLEFTELATDVTSNMLLIDDLVRAAPKSRFSHSFFVATAHARTTGSADSVAAD